MTDKEKTLTAYHEGGHAVATYYCATQDPVHQISIIPRGMAGGYTMQLPTEDRSYHTRKEMEEELVVPARRACGRSADIGRYFHGRFQRY